MFGKYQLGDDCIEYLGQFLSTIWELICLESIRIAFLTKYKPLPPTSTPISAASASPPSITFFERLVDQNIMEIAIERTVPVATCHFSKIQNPNAKAKQISFNWSDIQKDFYLLANGNTWTKAQLLLDSTGTDQVKLSLNEKAALRLTGVIEYILNDILQFASGILFSANRTTFTLNDIKASLKSDAALKELFELFEAVKGTATDPIGASTAYVKYNLKDKNHSIKS